MKARDGVDPLKCGRFETRSIRFEPGKTAVVHC